MWHVCGAIYFQRIVRISRSVFLSNVALFVYKIKLQLCGIGEGIYFCVRNSESSDLLTYPFFRVLQLWVSGLNFDGKLGCVLRWKGKRRKSSDLSFQVENQLAVVIDIIIGDLLMQTASLDFCQITDKDHLFDKTRDEVEIPVSVCRTHPWARSFSVDQWIVIDSCRVGWDILDRSRETFVFHLV